MQVKVYVLSRRAFLMHGKRGNSDTVAINGAPYLL
jgi:hypothetical protein